MFCKNFIACGFHDISVCEFVSLRVSIGMGWGLLKNRAMFISTVMRNGVPRVTSLCIPEIKYIATRSILIVCCGMDFPRVNIDMHLGD